MTFAERLKELRTEKGMTLDDVARHIGVKRPNIYKYEHGIILNVPPEKVHKLAQLFGVTRPYMMGWTDERNVNPSANLDLVAEKLKDTIQSEENPVNMYWQSTTLETADCITAATQALRAIVKFDITRTPVYPHKILQQSQLATMVSFEQAGELDEIILNTKLTAFRQMNDMVMSSVFTTPNGENHYIFAVNRKAPMGKVRLALAVELGHIYLGHEKHLINSKKKHNEAECFAIHLEFPRPAIRLLMDRGFVFTKSSFSRIFGDCEWCIDTILNAKPMSVSPELNRLVKEQFLPHIDLLDETGILSMPAYGEKLDLSKYMDGYED